MLSVPKRDGAERTNETWCPSTLRPRSVRRVSLCLSASCPLAPSLPRSARNNNINNSTPTRLDIATNPPSQSIATKIKTLSHPLNPHPSPTMLEAATYGPFLLLPTFKSPVAIAECCSVSNRVAPNLCKVVTSNVLGIERRSQGFVRERRRRRGSRLGARGGGTRYPVGEFGERILVSSDDEDGEDGDVGEIRLECDESGCVLVMPKSRTLAEEDDGGGFLRCDLTGCYFADEPAAEKGFEVIEGEGWRLGYETAPDTEESFCAIVGAGGWSLALTASEFNDFCYLIQALRKGIATMNEDGFIGKDEVVMQVERGSVWMECSIPKKRVAVFQNLLKLGNRALVESQQKTAFELRFILSGVAARRQAEGFWPAEAVMDMLKKIDATRLELEDTAEVRRPEAANA